MPPLAPHISHCAPLDTCWACQAYRTFLASDQAWIETQAHDTVASRTWLRRLKAWSRTHPEPVRSRLRATLTKLEREWPQPHPNRRLVSWPGWTSSSKK